MILRLRFAQAGFTLFELLLVMGVGVAITAIGMVSLSRLQAVFSLKSSADEIKSLYQYGRELAVANKDTAVYNLSLSGRIFKLTASGKEISRYQLPPNQTLNPVSFSWNFSAVTGTVVACSPCQVTMSALGVSEVINIQENGIAN